MKKAKEMFEELGYELFKDNNYVIAFFKDTAWIEFRKDIEVVKCYSLINNYYIEINSIGIKELQAINKMVEELGWDNE